MLRSCDDAEFMLHNCITFLVFAGGIAGVNWWQVATQKDPHTEEEIDACSSQFTCHMTS